MLEEFYPTPAPVIEKLLDGVDWKNVHTILEASAGKGDIADWIVKNGTRKRWDTERERSDIDCIEINPDLQKILKGKGYPVIYNDFLSFQTFKRYDLIVMNPPFSEGGKHLLKALELQKDGGAIACVLNAETIRNPYTNERKSLCMKLKEYNAQITYVEDAFVDAERKTSVEVAVIRVVVPETKYDSYILKGLKGKSYEDVIPGDVTSLEVTDYIRAAVNQYNMEVEAGVSLIREYRAMAPYIMEDLDKNKSYNKPLLELKLNHGELSENRYVESVRRKYWRALFQNKKFTARMTSNQVNAYMKQVEDLRKYDFSYYNIKEIQIRMTKNLVSGIEECIISLFEDFTRTYSWYPECTHNIHYYNGWASNKAWIINKKVVLPLRAYDGIFHTFRYSYEVLSKISDIEKALDYLGGTPQTSVPTSRVLSAAETNQQTKNIHLKYFDVTFYKKGTCHIVFKDLEVLKKLNIYGSQQKGWLPPAYGRRSYAEMSKEEKAVIDEFEGQESYQKVYSNPEHYIFTPHVERIA